MDKGLSGIIPVSLVLAWVAGSGALSDGPTAGVKAPAVKAGTKTHPVYEKDPRMQEMAALGDEGAQLSGRLLELGSQHHVILLADLTLRKKTFKFISAQREAKERLGSVLAQLAALVGGEWYAVRDRYVLARSSGLAQTSWLTWAECSKIKQDAGQALIDDLSPEQWARLHARETLDYESLSPHQRACVDRFTEGARLAAPSMEDTALLSPPHFRIMLMTGLNELMVGFSGGNGGFGVGSMNFSLGPRGNAP